MFREKLSDAREKMMKEMTLELLHDLPDEMFAHPIHIDTPTPRYDSTGINTAYDVVVTHHPRSDRP